MSSGQCGFNVGIKFTVRKLMIRKNTVTGNILDTDDKLALDLGGY